RIVVIHKENGGLSSARNVGIRAAKGEYIAFMDSDDRWNSNVSLNELVRQLRSNQEADILCFKSINFIDGEDGYYYRKDSDNIDLLNNIEGFRKQYYSMVKMGNIRESACTKIIKRNYLLKNDLFFQEGILG